MECTLSALLNSRNRRWRTTTSEASVTAWCDGTPSRSSTPNIAKHPTKRAMMRSTTSARPGLNQRPFELQSNALPLMSYPRAERTSTHTALTKTTPRIVFHKHSRHDLHESIARRIYSHSCDHDLNYVCCLHSLCCIHFHYRATCMWCMCSITLVTSNETKQPR